MLVVMASYMCRPVLGVLRIMLQDVDVMGWGGIKKGIYNGHG